MKNCVLVLILAICLSSCHTRAYLGEYFSRKIRVKTYYEDGVRKEKYKVCREWGVGIMHDTYNSGYSTSCGRKQINYYPNGKRHRLVKRRLNGDSKIKYWNKDGTRKE